MAEMRAMATADQLSSFMEVATTEDAQLGLLRRKNYLLHEVVLPQVQAAVAAQTDADIVRRRDACAVKEDGKTFVGKVEVADIARPTKAELKALDDAATGALHTDWIQCSGRLSTLAQRLIDAELGLTAYMLRSFHASLLHADGEVGVLTFTALRPLTGKWAEDKKSLRLSHFHLAGNPVPARHARLIMGFGPSASGKTHWAKNLVSIFSGAGGLPNFPNLFLSIDGGIYREQCVAYQAIVIVAKVNLCIGGFTNLVSTGVGGLFKSDTVKSAFKKYLQSKMRSTTVSLYVPETMGSCFVGRGGCDSIWEPYEAITGDYDWIAVLIWQHKENCPVTQHNHACQGTIASGTRRERSEGKKYSSSAWERSMANGDNALDVRRQNRKGSIGIKIHNPGTTDSVATLQDWSWSEFGKTSPASKILETKAHTMQYEYVKPTDFSLSPYPKVDKACAAGKCFWRGALNALSSLGSRVGPAIAEGVLSMNPSTSNSGPHNRRNGD